MVSSSIPYIVVEALHFILLWIISLLDIILWNGLQARYLYTIMFVSDKWTKGRPCFTQPPLERHHERGSHRRSRLSRRKTPPPRRRRTRVCVQAVTGPCEAWSPLWSRTHYRRLPPSNVCGARCRSRRWKLGSASCRYFGNEVEVSGYPKVLGARRARWQRRRRDTSPVK